MKPFIVALGVVGLTIPVLSCLVSVALVFAVMVGLWRTRGYWVPRVTYYGIALVAFLLGLVSSADAMWNPSHHRVSDLLFALTIDVVMVCLLFWWHHQKWIIQEMEFHLFNRRHERHLREALRVSY